MNVILTTAERDNFSDFGPTPLPLSVNVINGSPQRCETAGESTSFNKHNCREDGRDNRYTTIWSLMGRRGEECCYVGTQAAAFGSLSLHPDICVISGGQSCVSRERGLSFVGMCGDHNRMDCTNEYHSLDMSSR